jgi:short-subunit dehydrogenase
MQSYVFISGAGGVLGNTFARQSAAQGWNLLLTDIDETALTKIAEELRRDRTVDVRAFPCDLRNESAREELFRTLESLNLRIWMVINVAGIDFGGRFLDRRRSELRDIIRVNVESTVDISHMALGLRDGRKPFRIITVASLAGFYAMPFKATYAASKAFLINLMGALGEELREAGVSTTLLCPAGLKTRSDAVAAIESQGIMGKLTTIEVDRVVDATLKGAIKSRKIIIPGSLNRTLLAAGTWIPSTWKSKAIRWKWNLAHNRRKRTAANVPGRPGRRLAKLPLVAFTGGTQKQK